MPLSMMKEGESGVIRQVGGKEETRRFLENLGFVTGSVVTIISTVSGNLAVDVRGARIAIGKGMADKILV